MEEINTEVLNEEVTGTEVLEEGADESSVFDNMSTGEKAGTGVILGLAGYGAFKLGKTIVTKTVPAGINKVKTMWNEGKAKRAEKKAAKQLAKEAKIESNDSKE